MTGDKLVAATTITIAITIVFGPQFVLLLF
jgi:hypothetical protein